MSFAANKTQQVADWMHAQQRSPPPDHSAASALGADVVRALAT